MKNMVFLGGTCGNNNWRDGFINRLARRGVTRDALFNPVVLDWNDESRRTEDAAKASARFVLFYLGDPKQEDNRRSFLSLLEAAMGLYDAPDRTIVVFDTTGMPKVAVDSVTKAFQDMKGRFPDLPIFDSLKAAEDYIAERFVLDAA